MAIFIDFFYEKRINWCKGFDISFGKPGTWQVQNCMSCIIGYAPGAPYTVFHKRQN
jgi:hypothetical protein